MNQDRRDDVIGAVSATIGAELIVVLCIFIAAAIGCNVGALTAAVGQWSVFQ